MAMDKKRSVCNRLAAEGLATPERCHVVWSLGLVAVDNAENVEAVVEYVNG
jgi:hypothetical protein